MTYATKDKSTRDGAPIYCYRFTSAFGNFFFTNNNEAITLGGDVYDPTNVEHSNIVTSSALDSIITVDISMPVTNPLSALYCFLKTPGDLFVQIYRAHRGDDFSNDFKSEWIGIAIGSGANDDIATIKTGSLLQAKLNGSSGNILYQRVCNHTLYDARCKVNKDDFKITATVVKNRGYKIALDNDGAADNTLNSGTITVDRTGETRLIIFNSNNEIAIPYEFTSIEKGDTVTMYHGCNHQRLGDCKTKFNNVVNYGGFDFIPTVNPFTELKDMNVAQITTKSKKEAIWRGSVPYHWERV